MTRLAVLLPALLLVGPGQPSTRPALVLDFAGLAPADAARLDGRAVVLRVERDSLADDRIDYIAFDCAGPADLHRTVWLLPGEKVGTIMTVAGVLRVVRHPPSLDGLFPAFVELRLTRGRVVGVERE